MLGLFFSHLLLGFIHFAARVISQLLFTVEWYFTESMYHGWFVSPVVDGHTMLPPVWGSCV